MVLGWRRAFCTSIPRDREKQDHSNPCPSPRLSSKFNFFSSNPSTPRLRTQTSVSSPTTSTAASLWCRTTPPAPTTATTVPAPTAAAESNKLHCRTTKSSPRFFQFSNSSSPRSPSTFSFLKASLRISKTRCGICLQTVKTGQGTAIFTAECSHSFHFPCVAAHARKQGTLTCPVCKSTWLEMPVLSIHNVDQTRSQARSFSSSPSSKTIHIDESITKINNISKPLILKVYDDDEPLMSPTSGARFNPIPESDEENENVEFQGFFINCTSNARVADTSAHVNRVIDVKLSPEAAVISVGRSSETYAVVLKVKGPSAMGKTARRAPIDLVTVLDVSGKMTREKLQMMKKALRLVVSSLSADDRLSIVAFSTASKRLLPLRRMTTAGRRSASRIVDAIAALDGTAASATDALKKAVKVLEDRREKNPAASIILLSDSHDDGSLGNSGQPLVSSIRFSHLEIPVHTLALSQVSLCSHARPEDQLAKSIGDILSVMVQDLSIRLGFISGSAPAEIAAVYTYVGRPLALGSGSIRLGELYGEEERELLVELKVPSSSSAIGAHHVLAVRCSYKDPSTQELINCREQTLLVPRPHAVRSSAPNIQRLRDLFVTTRAVAEARKLIERNELGGAHRMLASARALLLQSSSGSGSEFVRGLEAELSELNWRKQNQAREDPRQIVNVEGDVNNVAYVDEKAEPLTPTSAWRAAERLAKLAVMRKSMNRVSDLHGFENARF